MKILKALKDKLHLQVLVDYSLGGTSWVSSDQNQRGYYLRVTPIEIDGDFYRIEAFSGYKALIHPVARKSDKGYKEAMRLVVENTQLVRNLITVVLKNKNFSDEVVEEVIESVIADMDKLL